MSPGKQPRAAVLLAMLPCREWDISDGRCSFNGLLLTAAQVLRGEWAGHQAAVTAVAEDNDLIVKPAGVTNRSIQILRREDCGRILSIAS